MTVLAETVVVDASALVEYLLGTGMGRWASATITRDHADLRIPALCDVEVCSAFRSVLLRGSMPAERAREAIQDYLDLPLTRHGHTILLTRIMALHDSVSAYDATYLALAEERGAPLLSADLRLVKAASNLGLRVVPLP